ncbi:uncharacterized protein LOC128903156 [Rissa tridactyla]|uniref:uncharacterized protein LOC128903156 n=1 Tax=Rissa tridactyla TaxID=75485 RepID=UPI0023BAE334|nr:uncharacterized protein LOC128903156 [Rissa tridactyla]
MRGAFCRRGVWCMHGAFCSKAVLRMAPPNAIELYCGRAALSALQPFCACAVLSVAGSPVSSVPPGARSVPPARPLERPPALQFRLLLVTAPPSVPSSFLAVHLHGPAILQDPGSAPSVLQGLSLWHFSPPGAPSDCKNKATPAELSSPQQQLDRNQTTAVQDTGSEGLSRMLMSGLRRRPVSHLWKRTSIRAMMATASDSGRSRRAESHCAFEEVEVVEEPIAVFFPLWLPLPVPCRPRFSALEQMAVVLGLRDKSLQGQGLQGWVL